MKVGGRWAYWGASALVLGAVAGVGFWANGSAREVPLRIEPRPLPPRAKNEAPAIAPTSPAPASETGFTPTPAPSRSSVRRVAVDVEGEVALPGVYYLLEGDRVVDAVRRAGGPTARGSNVGLNLAAPLRDGMKIVVPTIGRSPVESPPGAAPPAGTTDPGSGPDPGAEAGVGGEPATSLAPDRGGARSARGAKGGDLAPNSVDVNAAPPEELARLPGVGPSTARKIVEERERRGGFRTVEELLDVKGIGPAKLARMRPYVRV